MNIESQVLIAMLELSNAGSFPQKVLYCHARIPEAAGRKLLERMQRECLVKLREDFVEIDNPRRLELAVRAWKIGGNVERISRLLHWKEFEAMAALALECNGYSVQRNLRFKHGGRKWEIDVVGTRKPLVVCIDCKHWQHRLYMGTIQKIVTEQIERVRALINTLPNPIVRTVSESVDSYRFLPVIISLVVNESKFDQCVPIVPILQLQDFLTNLPTNRDSLLCLISSDRKIRKYYQQRMFE